MNNSPKESLDYVSTRNPDDQGTYAQTVIPGLANGGGLYMPKTTPDAFDVSFVKRLSKMKMADVSFAIMRKLVPEHAIDNETLKEMMKRAHNFEIPLDSIDEHTSVAHLDEGPTAAFKDIAARVLAELLSYENEKEGTKTNILAATSGDTGVAIADAFSGRRHETVTVLYPTNGVSTIQEKHMLKVATENKNVQVVPVDGNFNDAQNLVKLLIESSKLNPESAESIEYIREKLNRLLRQQLSEKQIAQLMLDAKTDNLGSANSINFWRLAPQITQYFVAYGKMVDGGKIKNGDFLTVSVPSGNLGHFVAGVLARDMGLPINTLIAGTNKNNAYAYLIGEGIIKSDGKHKTVAPSMDIEEPNNLERLLWWAAQKVDPKAKVDYVGIQRAIREFQPKDEPIPVSQFGITKKILNYLQEFIFVEDIETDEAIEAEMKRVSDMTDEKVVVDSHGAAGTNAAKVAREKGFITQNQQVVVFKTAHPDKFPVATANAGVKAPKAHPTIEPLKSMKLEEMDKPKATRSILKIREQVAKLSNLNEAT